MEQQSMYFSEDKMKKENKATSITILKQNGMTWCRYTEKTRGKEEKDEKTLGRKKQKEQKVRSRITKNTHTHTKKNNNRNFK